jgi:hypothetical protein
VTLTLSNNSNLCFFFLEHTGELRGAYLSLIIPIQKCFAGEQAKFAQVDIELGFYFLAN